MSDVIWAAGIAGMVGVVGNLVTFWGVKRQAATNLATVERQAETNIATAERQAEVELAKVQAEIRKLATELREAERQNRQNTYHRLLAVLDRFDMFATGYPPDEQPFESTLAEFNYLMGGIRLFGDQKVRDALGPVTEVFELIGRGMSERPEAPSGDRFASAYSARRADVIKTTAALTEAMRADITRVGDAYAGSPTPS